MTLRLADEREDNSMNNRLSRTRRFHQMQVTSCYGNLLNVIHNPLNRSLIREELLACQSLFVAECEHLT